MKKQTIILLSSILFVAISIYFWKFREPNTISESTEESKDVVKILEENRKNLSLEIEIAKTEPIGTKIELIGETEAVPDAIIDVPARISGRITSVSFVEGDSIKKGQKLATIDSPELAKLRSAYLVAKSKYTAAEQNLNRISSLVKMNLAAKQELIDAESNLKVIESEKISAEENLRANGLAIDNSASGVYTVFSPRSGLALSRNAIPGSIVLGNQILTTIAELSKLWFQAKIFENDLKYLSEGIPGKIILNAYPDFEFEGILEHIGEKVDPESRTVHARLVFKNKGRKAKIGLFGKAILNVNGRKGIQISEEAIQSYQNKKFIFIESKSNEFKWNEITTGITTDGKTEVISGITEGDRVVTKGAFELKAILFKSTFGGE
ncbi:efflux RND transporter periplasmic adaptor subunit [Leptospira sp. 2 VSF19]|uniref:Efflux RND transporter periplasmic adaptor subunit n=1 Tax=Leptospira soteropolitanensis TaxID=2950025 RepID=A0AAW5VHQ9_9LEPT|nr:efflux RND transporter periplasmic adaptor subunit [Leptospira soteropolitanensis]MCW7491190.1 efflux RND transporter periplasmic adaptor subunit [Leptospira soteropolitanensis]MCW7498774.1 efflux RND transporter periplasmic adaptor subunit [Leptospira soteropolitanensis]MCW7521633.1 efflux RND transporter periplasmic adaptor subunit [Leptospira soteropolitanensis]MCW7524878.1 efflux RND transporter periplasmic adaptor subunit [Leptospira soteropolitanensis]MCW7528745.1 efflux RND transport